MKAHKIFSQMPKGSTHIRYIGASQLAGGPYDIRVEYFKRTKKEWLVFTSDNDNEYEHWASITRRYKKPDEVLASLVPIHCEGGQESDLDLLKDARHRIANLSRAKVPFDDPIDGHVLRRLDAAIESASAAKAKNAERERAITMCLAALRFYATGAKYSSSWCTGDPEHIMEERGQQAYTAIALYDQATATPEEKSNA